MLNDAVPFRFQWPRNSELRVNGVAYRVYSRNPNSKVSNNMRDEPVDLSSAAFAGRNRIRLQVCSATQPDFSCGVELSSLFCCPRFSGGVSTSYRATMLSTFAQALI